MIFDIKKVLSSLFIIALIGTSSAQPHKTIKVFKPYKWMIGAHWSAIDDNGSKFGKLFDVKDSWNLLAYPSRLTVDRYFVYGWSMEYVATYSQYKTGKLINDSTIFAGTFFSFDVNGKYSFYQKYAPRARWMEPYFTFGLGYTYREQGAATHAPTVNLGMGLNFWVYKGIGIQLHSTAKFGVYPGVWETPENYLQHSAGIVVRFNGSKSQNSAFHKKKNGWAHKSKRYKEKRGGQ
ncbi:MAG: OOP family OmpA-OmpF porin [Flavobacteriaceae bacterium]|jgi:OOP family OmpA-OmpF porin